MLKPRIEDTHHFLLDEPLPLFGLRTVSKHRQMQDGARVPKTRDPLEIRIEEAGPAPTAFTPRTETRVLSSGGRPSSHVDSTPPGASVTAAGVQPPRAILTSQRSAWEPGRNAGPRRHVIVTPAFDHDDRPSL